MNAALFIIPELGFLATSTESSNRYNCIVCKLDFSSGEHLSVHYVISHQLNYCPHCSALFSTDNQLSLHIGDNHSHENCAIDNVEFDERKLTSATNNVGLVHPIESCDICHQTMVSVENYRHHLNHYHRILPSIDDTKTIFVKLNEDTYFCQLCSLRFLFNKFIEHYTGQHAFPISPLLDIILGRGLRAIQLALESEDSYNLLICSICDQRYTKEVPKMLHLIMCNGFKYCDMCNLVFRNENLLSDHHNSCISIANKNIPPNSELCKFCDEAIKLLDWTKHREEIHRISSDDIEAVGLFDNSNQCRLCDSTHSNINLLIGHYLLTHRVIHGYILHSLNLLHQSSNAGIYREVSGNTNDAQIDFDTRMVKFVYSSFEGTSSDESTTITRYTFLCKICEHKAISKLALINHMNKNHGYSIDPIEFRCHVCQRKFRSTRTLKSHARTKHWPTGTLLKCEFCAHKVSNRREMRIHIKQHLESTYHPCANRLFGYNCRYCQHSFWTEDKLNVHVMYRHAERLCGNFVLCICCASTISSLAALRSHMQLHHPNDDFISNEQFIFQCEICKINFPSVKDIRRHMTKVHPSCQTMFCPISGCFQIVNDQATFDSHNLQRHKIKNKFQCCNCSEIFNSIREVEMHYKDNNNHKSIKEK